jgi:acetyltransferase-like isoleucine patch superfamily enzyme
VVVGANSVVVGELPDNCVAVGAPAKVVRRFVDGRGWEAVEPT